MANMSLTKTPIAEQEPKVRARNFKEVTLGYTPEQAIEEAQRCLNCKHKPCMTGCPDLHVYNQFLYIQISFCKVLLHHMDGLLYICIGMRIGHKHGFKL